MNLLPYENFHIITNLKRADVQERLQKEVEPDSGFRFRNLFSRPSGSYFSGFVINGTFEFKRIIYYRNSFLPQISGSTEVWLNGSRLHVKMRMHIAVIIFMCLWLGGVGVAGFAFLVKNISKNEFDPVPLIPVGMFLFGYLLSTGAFKYESKKAKDKLLDMLDGEIENN